ncbi:MAG: hypothetical protein II997_03405 [Clostridia bacterium]|nr:hypothetical protein [Clostridia bacterium]
MERNQLPLKKVLSLTENIVPSMRYKEGEDFARWQEKGREKLKELLGLPFVLCDDLFSVESETECADYKEVRFTFQSEEGYFVPCHLLIPSGITQPVPVVLCLQGHSTGMHISLGRAKFPGDENLIAGGDRDFAIGAVKRGYCALTIEQRAMGECGSGENGAPACHVSTMANLLIGRTTIGERVWDVMRAIDVLEKYFSVVIDAENIICLGNSGGGTTTFYTACLEERIKTAIVSCAFASFDESISAMFHCTCNFVPGMRRYFDMGDLSGLIAPKNLMIVSGAKDSIFPLESAQREFEMTEALYKHTKGKCVHVIGSEGHRFYYDDAWKVYDEIF